MQTILISLKLVRRNNNSCSYHYDLGGHINSYSKIKSRQFSGSWKVYKTIWCKNYKIISMKK